MAKKKYNPKEKFAGNDLLVNLSTETSEERKKRLAQKQSIAVSMAKANLAREKEEAK